ncbi:condensin complex subunit 2 isoform X2 [Electrophorus electricus]|uniref:Condensin complex subunit 2 n=1 Tax=Electrophorus electricus TaxID=8005 RepID=A0A4W4FYV6_ELEEL|nr:condensin complex subunit 2 isoform X2 [Electrophorus electricus]
MSAVNTPTSRPRQWSSPAPGHKTSLSAASTPLLGSFQGNDDEQERRQRRRSKVIDLHAVGDTSISEAAPYSGTGTPAAVPKLSSAQISEHYSTCIKLSTENKITTKNAFGLHLIDYMADILKQKDSELNFKVAAGTLDASTKIYAVRVDAVHADAYRVLGGLGSETKPKEGPEGTEEAESVESTLSEQTAARQAPRKRPPKKTVEQNLNNINLSEAEMKCEVDPMFQRMAASFDENSTAGVFLSVLSSEDSRCELRFPSHLTLLCTREPCPHAPAQNMPASPFAASLKALEDRVICPSLQDFSFTQWTPDQGTSLNQLLEKMKRGEHAFDVNADVEPDEGEVPSLGDHFDADEDEGRHGDCGEGLGEHTDACTRMSPAKGRGVIPIGEADITTMCLQLSDQPREYSYFSPRTMATWVGPGYWLFKPTHKQDHKPEKEQKKRAPKSPLVIDFSEDIHFHNYFRTTRAATTISRSALNSTNKKTTLPSDFQYPLSNLSQLNLKPFSMLSAVEKKRLSGELSEEIGEYDYNNANDTANFCPGLQAGDSDDDAEGFTVSDETQPVADRLNPLTFDPNGISTYGEDCLVPEPHKVNIIEINYAKTAKKMDMKRLKNSMWTLLTHSTEKPASVENEVPTEVAGEKSFSQSTRTLLQRLPSTMASNLSVPLAFVALLHLANEKNLELHKVDDMSDIVIKQGH